MRQADVLITIGITCYNAQDTIARAIESALAQSWKNTEIIIVDDCSTDGSVDIIQTYSKKYDHVHLIEHKNNQGPAGARQSILDHAKGEFIVFFDDDDESLPQRVKTQHQRIVSFEEESGEKLIACYASGQRIYPNDYRVSLEGIGSKPKIPYGDVVANRLLFFANADGCFFGAGVPSCSLMARKQVFEVAGGFDKNFRRVEDVDFAIRLALAGGYFIGCSEELFVQYATNAVDKSPEKNLEAELQLVEKNKEYLESIGYYYYAKKWPLLRYYHFKNSHMQMAKILLSLMARYPVKTISHFSKTAPKRLIHELKMKRQAA